jgi:Cys-tRNA(Pro)/Cys-tRNA(Cys) deacylase
VETTVTRFLSERSISYRINSHPTAAFSCRDVARERKLRLSQIVKCMVAADVGNGLHVMLIPGDRMLKLRRVRALAGGMKIELVPPEKLASEYGVLVGAISPTEFFGRARIYIDQTVLKEEEVDISSGDPRAGIGLSSRDLAEVLSATRCDIISTSGPRS